jgi:hypothetical protein
LQASKLIRLSLIGVPQDYGTGARDVLATPALRTIRTPAVLSATGPDPASIVLSSAALAAPSLATSASSWTSLSALSVSPTGMGSVTGVLYVDTNQNGIADTADWAIRDVELRLTRNGASDPPLIAYTRVDGYYEFSGLPAGSYNLTVLTRSPATPWTPNVGGLYDSVGNLVAVSPAAGQAAPDAIANITLNDGYQGIGYNFGNTSYPLSAISKRLLINGSVPHVVPPPPPPVTPSVPEPGSLGLTAMAASISLAFVRRRTSA